jgi:lysozyme
MPLAPSSNCIALVKQFEGLRLRSYQDVGGVWTIGYGHIVGVTAGQTILQEQADSLLESDLQKACSEMQTLVTVWLNQNQVDALTSWVFNLGIGKLEESTLLRLLNMGQYTEIPSEMKKWVYAAGEIQPGLVLRRAAEAALWSQSI